ncbi:chorismate-binding protein [Hanstruepera ponticola]|uniref:chorismate-binding protein n=1 Tax=Hanstruepera ponticola TaxID=2042995 RepID=UPI000CF18D38|nr:chorismate-binding protein [Hanstruepera ponticola]
MTSELFFNVLESHYNESLPFVVYRKSNKTNLIGLLQNNTDINFVSSFTESGFVMAPFDNENDPIIIPLKNAKHIETDDYQEIDFNEHQEQFDSNQKDKQSHIDLVSKGIVAIKDEKFDKVVLSRKEDVEIKEGNPFKLFKKLLDSYPQAFVYCWFHPETGLWLGATPETLLEIENKRLTTMSLAGTKPYKGTVNVNWSAKEIQEQKIVTDYLVEQLDNQIDSLQISDTQTIRAGNLVHLKTMVSGILKSKGNSLKNVINKLHPTPAVCGFPKVAAKHFILENENYNRAFYTGYLGELNYEKNQSRNRNFRNIENNAYSSIKKVTNLFVNLRCMKLLGNKAQVYVGGGITSDSNPEQEWEETVAKTTTIKKVLQ